MTWKKIHQLFIAFSMGIFIPPNVYALLPTHNATSVTLASQISESIYIAVINHFDTKQIIHVLTDSHQNHWFRGNDLVSWRLPLPPPPPISYNGYLYYKLPPLANQRIKINGAAGKILVNFPPQNFKPYSLNIKKKPTNTTPMPSKHTGAFLNYDFFSQRDYLETINKSNPRNSSYKSNTSADIGLGVFNQHGNGQTNFVIKNIAGSDHAADNPLVTKQNQVIRLNTSWHKDLPSKMQSWTLGDSISRPGAWGSAVSFGGIQWGTNFATQPYFNKMPLPSVQGIAQMPSIASIYINNSLVSKENLQSGPFTLRNLPIVTGGGNIILHVKNILGKDQAITIPYYTDSSVLRKGLHEFSLGAGFVRRNYGIDSFNYGEPMVYGTSNYGITDRFTRQLHTELTPTIQAAGIGASFILGHYASMHTSIAASRTKDKFGGLAMIALDHSSRGMSYGINSQITTSDFHTVGLTEKQKAPRIQNQLYLYVPAPLKGNISFSLINQENRLCQDSQSPVNGANVTQMAAGYTVSFHGISLSLNATTNISGPQNKQIYLTLLTNFANDKIASLQLLKQNNREQAVASIEKPLPIGKGYGYHVEASTGKNNQYLGGGLKYHSDVRTYSLDIQHFFHSNTSYQAEVRGSFVIMHKHIKQSRYIDGMSFALVRIPNIPNIPINLENQYASKTDQDGYAIIPNLIPYIENNIEVDSQKLPLNTKAKETETVLIPFASSGIFWEFNIHKVRNGSLVAKLPSGKFVPLNASIAINGKKLYNTSVAKDGVVYLSNFREHKNTLYFYWPDKYNNIKHCSVEVNYKSQKNDLPYNFGEVTCIPHQADLAILGTDVVKNLAGNTTNPQPKHKDITHIATDKTHPKSAHHLAERIAEDEPAVDEPQMKKNKQLDIAIHHQNQSLHLTHA